MTKPSAKDRNARRQKRNIPPLFRALIWAILLVALWLRLDGADFGLPALNDPDEPLFMMTAIDMLRGHSLNPGWFGHPGTTVFYIVAVIILAVGGLGMVSGRYETADAFVAAVYMDPAIIFMPARLFFVACGVAVVWLTYCLGRRLGDARAGLIAAAALAVNAVHIHYSQIIRTDMLSSLFMLLCALRAVAIARDGTGRDYLLAGVFLGLACATKWPAALISISIIGAWLCRFQQGQRDYKGAVLCGVAALMTLFLVSPYLLLAHETVLHNLTAEGRAFHPGATGQGGWRNFLWYVQNPLSFSLGWAGLFLAAVGMFQGVGDRRRWLAVILPFCLLFFCVISLQSLRWERWVVPILPFLALALAGGVACVTNVIAGRFGNGRRMGFCLHGLMLAGLMTTMMLATQERARERAHDTRQIASRWVKAHVPPGHGIVMEHAGFDLLAGPWPLLFPLGKAGCVDVRALLGGRIGYGEVEEKRAGSPIVDIGHVDRRHLASCRADYAIISHYARYSDAERHYAAQIANYRALLAGGTLLTEIRPEKGRSAGPVVQIFRLRELDGE